MNKKFILFTVVVAVLATLTIVGTHLLREEKSITLQGEVEIPETKVSSKLAGRVDSVAVHEGQYVTKGQFLFSISTPEVDAKLKQAKAAKSGASAQRQKAEVGARKQVVESAKNLWKQAKAGANLAETSYKRVENLFNDGVVSEQQRDEVRVKYEVAKRNEKIAKAQYDMAVEGAQKEDKMAANALVERADGAVEEVESYLSDASQYAPYSGEISSIVAKNGELVSTGLPVVTIADVSKPEITFNVKEDLLPSMQKGSKINVYVPGIDKDIELEIYHIAVQAEYATWTSTRSKGSFDIRTFAVKAVPTSKIEGLRAGMTVVYDIKQSK